MRELHNRLVAGSGYGGGLVFEYAGNFKVVGHEVDGGRLAEPRVGHDQTVALPGAASRSPNADETKVTHQRGLLYNTRITLPGVAFKGVISDIRDTKPMDLVRKVISCGVDLAVVEPLADNDVAARTCCIELTRAEVCQSALVLVVAQTEIKNRAWDGIPDNLLHGQLAATTHVKVGLAHDDAAQAITLIRV